MLKKPTNSEAQSTSRQIAAQSNLKFVMEYSVHNDKELTLKEIISIVNVLNEFVECGYSKQIGERIDKIDEYLKLKTL